MNILYISHLFPNPIEPVKGTFVRDKVLAVSQLANCRVIAPVSWFPIVRPRNRMPGAERTGDIVVYHPCYLALPRMLFSSRWKPYYACLRTCFARMKFRPDILAVDWVYPDAFAVAQLAAEEKLKFIVTVHGNRSLGKYGNERYRDLFAAPLTQANAVIAVSHQLKQTMTGEMGIVGQKINVIANGIDPEKFSMISRTAARKALGLPQKKRLVLAVARLSQEKALDIMIEAVSNLTDEGVCLAVIGDGPQRKDLQRKIDSIGLSDRATLCGAVPHDNITQWINAADVLCLSSVHEGSPVVIYEALACGTPVVATRIGGIPDIITAPEYGLLSDPGDAEDLATALHQALSKDWDRQRIMEYGRRFTWKKVAKETFELLEDVMTS